MSKKIKIKEERLSAEEYTNFLKRTDLGSQYPKERFVERISKLVNNVSISLVARNKKGLIVGVLFGLTDYAYWLYVTDLGVDRDYEGQGIGRQLMKTAHLLTIFLQSNGSKYPCHPISSPNAKNQDGTQNAEIIQTIIPMINKDGTVKLISDDTPKLLKDWII